MNALNLPGLLLISILLVTSNARADDQYYGHGSSNDYALDPAFLKLSFEQYFEQTDLIFLAVPMSLEEAPPKNPNSSYCYLQFRALHWYKGKGEYAEQQILPLVFEKTAIDGIKNQCPIVSKEPYLIFAPKKDGNGNLSLINPALYPTLRTATLLRDLVTVWAQEKKLSVTR